MVTLSLRLPISLIVTSPSKAFPLEWKFDINPVAASRPRVGRWGAYYSGPYKVFREVAAEKVWNTLGTDFTPLGCPLMVTIEFYVKRPKKTEKRYPRPDIDNYVKAILDTMNGKIWEDDSQVTTLYATKHWAKVGEEGYFVLAISEN